MSEDELTEYAEPGKVWWKTFELKWRWFWVLELAVSFTQEMSFYKALKSHFLGAREYIFFLVVWTFIKWLDFDGSTVGGIHLIHTFFCFPVQ